MPDSSPELNVSEDPARVVGELLAEQATRGGSIVLTGGHTPAAAYRREIEGADFSLEANPEAKAPVAVSTAGK